MRDKIMNVNEMWNLLSDYEVATEEELQLVTNIMGYNEEALEGILYARTGFNSFDQFLEEM